KEICPSKMGIQIAIPSAAKTAPKKKKGRKPYDKSAGPRWGLRRGIAFMIDPRLLGIAGASGLRPFGDRIQTHLVANNDALTAAFDDTGSLPGAHDAADRVQSRCDHFREILPAHGKVDFDALRIRYACLTA